MRNISKEAMELIKELCQKEVERTGLPLVLDENTIYVEEETIYFRQRMHLMVNGYDVIYLENQYDIDLENGKWKTSYSDNKFYGYELFLSRNNYSLTISLNHDNIPTEEKISEKLSSDKFREMFEAEKQLDKELWQLKEKITRFIRKG